MDTEVSLYSQGQLLAGSLVHKKICVHAELLTQPVVHRSPPAGFQRRLCIFELTVHRGSFSVLCTFLLM